MPECINVANRITGNTYGYVESNHPYAPTNGTCEFRIELENCMIEYRVIEMRLSKTDSFRLVRDLTGKYACILPR